MCLGEKKTLDSRTRKELSSWKKINSKKEKLDCLTSPALLLIREPPQPWFYSPPRSLLSCCSLHLLLLPLFLWCILSVTSGPPADPRGTPRPRVIPSLPPLDLSHLPLSDGPPFPSFSLPVHAEDTTISQEDVTPSPPPADIHIKGLFILGLRTPSTPQPPFRPPSTRPALSHLVPDPILRTLLRLCLQNIGWVSVSSVPSLLWFSGLFSPPPSLPRTPGSSDISLVLVPVWPGSPGTDWVHWVPDTPGRTDDLAGGAMAACCQGVLPESRTASSLPALKRVVAR